MGQVATKMHSESSGASSRLNIVLTGFMGTGKSAVGGAVAERLGRFFVDMDEIIAQRAGKPIRAIFAEDGEQAFRSMEASLCWELAGESGIVVATGGGALVPATNREAMAQSGVLFCLTATPEAILERLEEHRDRPLLDGTGREERIRQLLAQRAAVYGAIPYQIDTTGRAVAEIAEQVIRLYRRHTGGATRIPVQAPGHDYDILVGEGLLAEAGGLAAEAGIEPGRCAIVTNPEVGVQHGARLAEGLREAGFEPAVVEMPEGERHKTLATVAMLYERFLQARLDRRSAVFALGGGVVGDVAGFAAATFLRGVPLVPVPTSLLAMVDASVGGKVGVDLAQGKNLVGAFKQPQLVIVDPEVLKTLPSEEFRSGLAEVVKAGMIGDPGLFAVLEGRAPAPGLGELIARAVRVKVAVVEEDPFEGGRRAVLNLGHTFGHALELLSGYRMRHGEAVGLGIALATRLAAATGTCEPGLVRRVEELLERLELPTRGEGFAPEEVVAAMGTDKKRAGGRLRFVVPRAIGDVELRDDVPTEAVLAVLAEAVGNQKRAGRPGDLPQSPSHV